MTETRPPIPGDLKNAFGDALANYHYWKPSEDEPTVSYKQEDTKISTVCHLLMDYSGSMPPALISLLARETHIGVVPTDFKADDSYANGGKHLLKLIDYRKREYRLWADQHK